MVDFDTFLDATRATVIPGTLPTLNLSIKSHPSCLYKGKKFYCISLHTFPIQCFSLLFARAKA